MAFEIVVLVYHILVILLIMRFNNELLREKNKLIEEQIYRQKLEEILFRELKKIILKKYANDK